MVGNEVKKAFSSFISYIKLKEKETIKKLDDTYKGFVKELKGGAKCCN